MRRLVLALAVSLGLTSAGSLTALGDVSGTQVILSCSDGHSVVLFADTATLASLTADVAAINASGSALACSVDPQALDPSAQAAEWTVYDYNPSGRGIRPRSSPNSMPATTNNGTTSFQFIPGIFTALLVTKSPAYTGDQSQKTLSDAVTWSGTGGFSEQNGGGCTPDQQYVRFYFESPSASGPSTGSPPAGFYTQFWWSNPMRVDLAGDAGTGTMSAPLAFPAAAHQWSDWNGTFNDFSPALTEAFVEATQKVQMMGVSYGGGCFFENGLTTGTGGTFSSTFGAA